MTNDEMSKDLEELMARFYEGWHEGITIDASDIMLLAEATIVIRNIAALPVPEVQWRDLTDEEIDMLIDVEEYIRTVANQISVSNKLKAVIAKFKEKQL